MPYLEAHYLITVMGDSWTQTETWQFSVRGAPEATPTPTSQQDLANALATPTQTFFGSAAANISNKCRLTAIKVAAINPDGRYAFDTPPGLYTYPTPVVGPSAGAVIPQQTIAVSTLTPFTRGRAHAGRFYLPPAFFAVAGDGRILATDADAIEAAARTWLLAINATAQVRAVQVMSKLGTGTSTDVTAVGVGRVIDTMRSRRRSLAEGRTPLAL